MISSPVSSRSKPPMLSLRNHRQHPMPSPLLFNQSSPSLSVNSSAQVPPSPFTPQSLNSSLHQPPSPWPPRSSPSFWKGDLPHVEYTNPQFSQKIFVGGVPGDMDTNTLEAIFGWYGPCRAEWPKNVRAGKSPNGYAYIVFELPFSASFLLVDCVQSTREAGEFYYQIQSSHGPRFVQLVPWVLSDEIYSSPYRHANSTADVNKTVFVGALHGKLSASILAKIMKETYGGEVVQVVLNTDRYKYPIGSGRVTFADETSYNAAVEAEFLDVHTSQFVKTIQIDPYRLGNRPRLNQLACRRQYI